MDGKSNGYSVKEILSEHIRNQTTWNNEMLRRFDEGQNKIADNRAIASANKTAIFYLKLIICGICAVILQMIIV